MHLEHPEQCFMIGAFKSGRTILNGKCRPVCHTVPLLLEHLTHRHCSNNSNDESSSDDESEQGGLTDWMRNSDLLFPN